MKHTFIATTFLSILLIACHSNTATVSAKPVPGSGTTGFHDAPVKATITPMGYDTVGADRQQLIAKLDAYYRTQVKAGFNGSVLIGFKGKVLYERYYGVSNKEAKIPLSADNACQLASISKTFTGAAILYLYDHKYIGLDDLATKYLKDFPYPAITIRMMLNHRSGLPDYTHWVADYKDDQKTPISNDEMMKLMILHRPSLAFTPNSRFTYCNTNFAVLATIVETVTGMGFREFMTKYFFEPLGMSHSFICDVNKGLPANSTISYKGNWQREPNMFADGVVGDKNVYSTVEDMYRWDQSFYNKTLLSNETIELAYGPCSFEKKGVKNYGLGWRMLCYPNGDKIIYHNGWWHGNNTSFYRFIKDNFTIVVLGNKHNNSIYHQAQAITAIINGKSSVDGEDGEE